MKNKFSIFRLILGLLIIMGQLVCSCSTDDGPYIGGSAPYYSYIVDVRNSKGESLLNPATENNYVGKSIKVVVERYNAVYMPDTAYIDTIRADWSEAFWNKDMWRRYSTIKGEYPEERYILKDCFHILSKDKKINSQTDKLLCIGLFEPGLYSHNFSIEWPDGKIDSITSAQASSAEGTVYWYVNNRKVQEYTTSSPDTPLRIVHN